MERTQSAASVRTLLPALALCLLASKIGNAQNEENAPQGHPAPAAQFLTIEADGERHVIRAPRGTVADVLAAAGIVLGEKDECSPDAAQPVHPGMTIVVSRVVASVVTQTEPIRAGVRVVASRSLRSGFAKIRQEPEDGLKELVYKVLVRNGRVVDRELLSARVIRPVKDKVFLVGGSRARLPSRSGYFTGRRVITMEATGYDPGPLSCGPYADGRTYTGIKARRGVAAVDPTVIPLGARLYVEGYGKAIAADIGGAIKGNRIDLCFDTRQEALRFGRRKVRVWILSP